MLTRGGAEPQIPAPQVARAVIPGPQVARAVMHARVCRTTASAPKVMLSLEKEHNFRSESFDAVKIRGLVFFYLTFSDLRRQANQLGVKSFTDK